MAAHDDAIGGFFGFNASFVQHVQRHTQILGGRSDQFDLAPGNSRGAGIGTRLDTIRHHRISGAVQFLHARDGQLLSADALDLGTHGNQAVAQIDNLRLTRDVFQNGRALAQHGSHHGIFRGAH